MNLGLVSEPYLAPRSMGEAPAVGLGLALAVGLGLIVSLHVPKREGEVRMVEKEGVTKQWGEGGGGRERSWGRAQFSTLLSLPSLDTFSELLL